MRESLTQIVERAYAALNRRDLDAFLELSDPQIEIISLIAEAEGGTFRGHEGLREWWNRVVVGSLGGIRFTIDEIRELDDEMIVVKLVVAGEAGGVQVEQVMWQAIQVADRERAIWWQPFRTEQEALDAIEARRA
jgi:ketosteroid isomerase-like protein